MRPEDRLQSRARMFLDEYLLPPAYYTAIEHGRKHAGTPQQRAREWERLKAKGVKAGLPDLMVWGETADGQKKFIAIELKAGKNTTSANQDAFAKAMYVLDFSYCVCRSVEEIGWALLEQRVSMKSWWDFAAKDHDAALARETPPKRPRATKPRAAKPTAAQVKAIGRMRARTVF
jgi:hypothetical protein